MASRYQSPGTGGPSLLEAKRPDLAVTLIETLVEAIGTPEERKEAFKAKAKAMGLPESSARKIYDRFSNKYRVVVDTLRKANTVDILKLLDHCIIEVMESLSVQDWSAVSARDKAVIGGIMMDKRQLLSGEPTAIVSVEDRRNLDELTEAWIKEAKRRGQVVDLEPGDYSVDVDGGLQDVTPKVKIVELSAE